MERCLEALFGGVKGAFTGATGNRKGLLRAADQGMLFLYGVGVLGIDEQSILLRAIEEKRFLPAGAKKETESNFQLICGTNRNLQAAVSNGLFREDLLSRIKLWTFHLPGLKNRPEDGEMFGLGYAIDKLAELQSEADALIAFKTGRGVLLFQIMLYPVDAFFKINGPGISFFVPFDI